MNLNKIDPDFDGHLEHPLSSMTVPEKFRYLWEQTLFHHWARNAVKQVREDESEVNSSER